MTRRIFVSLPADRWLTTKQNELKWAIVEKIEQLQCTPEIFLNPKVKPGDAAGKPWSRTHADTIMRKCIGAAIIGLPRWEFKAPAGDVFLPSEFCHYEGAVAYTLGLPMLVLVQEQVQRRVIFHENFGEVATEIPHNADRRWLDTDYFHVPFSNWNKLLKNRRDIFLGYCGSSAQTALKLREFLEGTLGATVLDWMRDFKAGSSILEEIREAAARCSAGIFLFTRDDKLPTKTKLNMAAPRDNVVFEAGYFINAKGKGRVLIVRQTDAKMPADLGGDIYASLHDLSNIAPIQDTVKQFVEGL